MATDIRDCVAVITGASSGIGRATAQALARRGAEVVLGARNLGDLEAAAEECRQVGGRAHVIPVDVADEGQVRELADRALSTLGRIDAWINDAGVLLYGRAEEVPIEAFRRVIDVNLMGTVHGARAAIPIFREQGEGILVNVASLAGCIGDPFASAYVASKWAVRGLSESLRMELADAPGIHVCTVLPAYVDTPLFQHSANYTGRAVQPAATAHPAGEVAEAVLSLLVRPQREIFVGANGRLLELAKAVMPTMVEERARRRLEERKFQDRSAAASPGNLYSPAPGAISGGWGRRAAASRRRRVPVGAITAAALAAIPLGLLAWRQAQGRT